MFGAPEARQGSHLALESLNQRFTREVRWQDLQGFLALSDIEVHPEIHGRPND
jgi:hypothetical protein